MRRRAFVASLGTGALALMVRRAFGDATLPAEKKSGAPVSEVDLRAALERARAAGVPLFVIVIPEDDSKKYDVGQAWGELLNHATPADLAPLARAEVVCARMARIAQVAAPAISGSEPLAVVIDPESNKVSRVMHANLAAYEQRFFVRAGKDDKKPRPDDEVFGDRVATMSKLVRGALQPANAGEVPALMASVKKKLVDEPPPGSHWGNASGCGPTRVEPTAEEKARAAREEEEARKKGIFTSKVIVGYGCGMGHIPAKSSRFLYFFAKIPAED
jgi:hypothetical protein